MKSNELKIGCVVMAAGRSLRFGRNKLLEEYNGKSLAGRALDAVPADRLYRVVVVTRFNEIEELAEAKGFITARSDCPEAGVSLTIRLGLEKLEGADAALFMVCDQPLLTRASVSAAVDFYREHPDRIVSMAFNGLRGNPCIFPSDLFPELSELSGDNGGSAVIRRNETRLLLFQAADASELKDADNVCDLC